MSKAKNLDIFLKLVTKLEPIEFLGCAKILGVQLVDEEKEPRPFEKVFSEMLMKFTNSNKKFQKDFLKILRASAKKEKK